MAIDPCVKETLSSRAREYCWKDNNRKGPSVNRQYSLPVLDGLLTRPPPNASISASR
jgi:hypothetical protein